MCTRGTSFGRPRGIVKYVMSHYQRVPTLPGSPLVTRPLFLYGSIALDTVHQRIHFLHPVPRWLGSGAGVSECIVKLFASVAITGGLNRQYSGRVILLGAGATHCLEISATRVNVKASAGIPAPATLGYTGIVPVMAAGGGRSPVPGRRLAKNEFFSQPCFYRAGKNPALCRDYLFCMNTQPALAG